MGEDQAEWTGRISKSGKSVVLRLPKAPGFVAGDEARIVSHANGSFSFWKEDNLGEHLWQLPWRRLSEFSEPTLLILPYFLWRLATGPIRGRLFDPSPSERLELGHIAACIDPGFWFGP